MKQFLISITLIFSIITFISINSNAQQAVRDKLKNATPQQRAKFITDTMKTTLALNNIQYNLVYNINLDIAEKNAIIFKSDVGKISKFEQLKSNQNKRDSALKTVLTKEQFIVYKKKTNEIISAVRKQH